MAIEPDPALVAEIREGCTRFRIERVQIFAAHGKDSRVGAVAPVRYAARALTGGLLQRRRGGLLDPDRFSGGRLERLNQPDAVGRIEHAVDDDRRAAEV